MLGSDMGMLHPTSGIVGGRGAGGGGMGVGARALTRARK